MNKVYFKKLENLEDSINDIVHSMLQMVKEKENIQLKGTVPLKVHFGEKGNDTYIKSDYMNGVKKFLKEENVDTCYIETNVLYKGERTFKDSHIKLAKEHGFDDLDIVIADGDEENMYNEVEINQKNFKSCKIGYAYKDYNQYMIISHFKGHGMAGFGGAIKQLAMGFASRGGKLHQHSQSVPIINEDACISCGACVMKCPVEAIIMDDKAKIIPEKCVGCASCTTICPVEAITNSWQVSNFHEKLAEYAYAATRGKENIYIQYAFNITAECDCFGGKQDIISPNIGVFVSTDPVAIDQATYDKYESLNTGHSFETANITLKHAEDIGLGSRKYDLIEL